VSGVRSQESVPDDCGFQIADCGIFISHGPTQTHTDDLKKISADYANYADYKNKLCKIRHTNGILLKGSPLWLPEPRYRKPVASCQQPVASRYLAKNLNASMTPWQLQAVLSTTGPWAASISFKAANKARGVYPPTPGAS